MRSRIARKRFLHTRQTKQTFRSPAITSLQFPNERVHHESTCAHETMTNTHSPPDPIPFPRVDAAENFERAGKPAEAAKALETALRRNPHDAAALLGLGALLARHGRIEQAIKALQRINVSAPERWTALPLLARAFEQTGLLDAAREAREEMDRLGIAKDTPNRVAFATKKDAATTSAVVLYGR